MSLQIWLPLNGDLRQQGCCSNTITNYNATIDDYGKIGKCYSFSGNNYLKAENVIIPTETWSFSAWIYPTTESMDGHKYIVGLNTSTAQDFLGVLCLNTNKFSVRVAGTTYSSTITYSLNTWYHFAATYDNGTLKMYINGILDTTITTVAPVPATNFYVGMRGGGVGAFKGKINDVRVYDHVLSLAEIKEISKGLIAHYKLDTDGMPNLLPYTKVNTINKNLLKTNINNNWNNLTITTIDGYDCYNYPSSWSGSQWHSGIWFQSMEANTTYTYSAWLYFTANSDFNFTHLGHFQVCNDNSTASDKTHEDVASARIYEPSVIKANTWTKIRITFTTNNLAGSYFRVYPRYNIAANIGELYFRDCKLEKNDNTTVWRPNVVDNEYEKLGYNSTNISDCSGNGYKGTSVGTFIMSSNTPRYSICTMFDGSTNQINLGSTPFISGNKLPTFTIAFWLNRKNYTDSTQRYIYAGICNVYLYTNYSIRISWKHDTASTSTDNTWSPTLTPGAESWHHICFTFNNGVMKVYYDGTLHNTSDRSSSGTLMGMLNTTSNLGKAQYGGSLSDFRIYSTCLSADDIKALYNTAAKVSKDNKMLCYEIKEN